MLDLHCHLLPGVDDGAATLTEALAMARRSVEDGITHITVTPHCNRSWAWYRPDILPRVAALQDELDRAEIPLTVLPGSEIQLRDTTSYRREFEAGRFCHLGDRRAFTLLEFNWNGRLYPADAPDLVRWLRDQGMTPLIAHPERQSFLVEEPGRLASLVEAGAWLQLTVDSLLGCHGDLALELAQEVLATFDEIVLATDSHDLGRCSGLSAGYTWVENHLGSERAADMRARSEHILTELLR